MKTNLITLCGRHPQIITETLFGLKNENISISEISILTTEVGRKEVLAFLVGADSQLEKFNYQYESDAKISVIYTLKDSAGYQIDDITTVEHNQLFIKLCNQVVSEKAKEKSNLILSIAGGRKTMSSCLMLSAQLFCRPQDRIVHVSISEEFERSSNFFFPEKETKAVRLVNPKGEIYYKDCSYADVKIIDIPFIALRENLKNNYLDKLLNEEFQKRFLFENKDEKLALNLIDGILSYADIKFTLKPLETVFYGYFLFAKLKGLEALSFEEFCQGIPKMQELYNLNLSKREFVKPLFDQFSFENFQSYKSKINRTIKSNLSPNLYKKFSIQRSKINSKVTTKWNILAEKHEILNF